MSTSRKPSCKLVVSCNQDEPKFEFPKSEPRLLAAHSVWIGATTYINSLKQSLLSIEYKKKKKTFHTQTRPDHCLYNSGSEMARKTLDSNSKRKAEKEEEDVKIVQEPTGYELLSSLVTKKKKFQPAGSIKRSGNKDEFGVKKAKKSVAKKEEAVEENSNGADYVFPMNRVTRIVKSENPDIKLSAEAAFLFNKASEKFLQLFSKEAYACASKEGKKNIEYHHLSSLIPGNTRFEFLSDFVPAKVKVADALKET